jgi:hypothetical protein
LQTASATDEDSLLGNSARGLAEQLSDISNRLLLTVDAAGSAQANFTGLGGAAEARTFLEVSFAITDSPLLFVATGSLLESALNGTAAASIELLGASTIFSTSNSGTFAFSGLLGPGDYVLRTSAESLVSGNSGNADTTFDLEFVLQSQEQQLPEPASTVSWLLLSLAFGVAAWRRSKKQERAGDDALAC